MRKSSTQRFDSIELSTVKPEEVRLAILHEASYRVSEERKNRKRKGEDEDDEDDRGEKRVMLPDAADADLEEARTLAVIHTVDEDDVDTSTANESAMISTTPQQANARLALSGTAEGAVCGDARSIYQHRPLRNEELMINLTYWPSYLGISEFQYMASDSHYGRPLTYTADGSMNVGFDWYMQQPNTSSFGGYPPNAGYQPTGGYLALEGYNPLGGYPPMGGHNPFERHSGCAVYRDHSTPRRLSKPAF